MWACLKVLFAHPNVILFTHTGNKSVGTSLVASTLTTLALWLEVVLSSLTTMKLMLLLLFVNSVVLCGLPCLIALAGFVGRLLEVRLATKCNQLAGKQADQCFLFCNKHMSRFAVAVFVFLSHIHSYMCVSMQHNRLCATHLFAPDLAKQRCAAIDCGFFAVGAALCNPIFTCVSCHP